MVWQGRVGYGEVRSGKAGQGFQGKDDQKMGKNDNYKKMGGA